MGEFRVGTVDEFTRRARAASRAVAVQQALAVERRLEAGETWEEIQASQRPVQPAVAETSAEVEARLEGFRWEGRALAQVVLGQEVSAAPAGVTEESLVAIEVLRAQQAA